MVKRTSNGNGKETLTVDERRDLAVEKYLAGERVRKIEEETGVSRPRLYAVLQARGIRPQRIRKPGALAEVPAEKPPEWVVDRLLRQEREIGRLQAELDAANQAVKFMTRLAGTATPVAS